MYIGDQIRLNYVKKFLPKAKEKGKRCLDAGCGNKQYKEVILEAGYEWYGIDKDPIDKEVTKLDLEKIILGTDFYDLIVCVDVLEHLEYPYEVFKNLNHLLKSPGRFILHIPSQLQTHILVDPEKNEEHKVDGFLPSVILELFQRTFKTYFIIPTFEWNEAIALDLNYIISHGGLINPLLNRLLNFDVTRFKPYGILAIGDK